MFPLLGVLNPFDVLMLIVLFIGGVYGLTRGAAPQIISAVSIWLALIISLWLYLPLSRRIIGGVFQNWTPNVTDAIAFFILFGVFFHALRLIVNYLIFPPDDDEKKKKAEEKRRKRREQKGIDDPPLQRFVIGPLNLIVGFIMGIGLTILWWAIVLGMLQFILQRPETLPPGFLQSLSYSMTSSYLIAKMFNPVLFYLTQSVQLFIPAGATLLSDMLNIILYTR
jgi:uncharacterized membrane protein required for colicin V production